MQVLAEAGTYRPATDYTILSAAGGITGTFGSVTSNLAFLNPELSYSGTAVTLTLVRNDIDFATFGQTPNEVAIADLVESLGYGNALYDETLTLADRDVSPTFAALTGEIYPSYSSRVIETAELLRRQSTVTVPVEQGPFVWATGLINGVGNGDVGGESLGIAGGVGYAAGDIAVTLGLGQTDMRQHDVGAFDDENTFAFGRIAYGGATGIGASVGVQFGWTDSEFTRFTALGSISGMSTSSGEGDYFQLFGEVSYGLAVGQVEVRPFAGVSHVALDLDGWNESGSPAALAVESIDREVTFANMGLRLAAAAEADVRPFASLAYRHAWGDRASVAEVGIGGSTETASITGAPIAKSGVEMGAGVMVPLGPLDVELGYSGMVSSEFDSHGINLRLGFRF